MYELIVFDWDGTLMDSESRIVTCVQAAAADLSWTVPDYDATKEIIGLGLNEAMARLFPQRDADEVQQMADQYRLHFLADQVPGSVLFDGAREVLSHLADTGYFIAVATGKSRRGLDRVLGALGLEDLFDATRCADETSSKPDPLMINELLDERRFHPKEAIMVGDTEYDLEMARNAGVASVGVSFGVHSVERLSDHGPIAIIHTLPELLDLPELARA